MHTAHKSGQLAALARPAKNLINILIDPKTVLNINKPHKDPRVLYFNCNNMVILHWHGQTNIVIVFTNDIKNIGIIGVSIKLKEYIK